MQRQNRFVRSEGICAKENAWHGHSKRLSGDRKPGGQVHFESRGSHSL
jgi:hypothetical protein